jgi:hypothetical protein
VSKTGPLHGTHGTKSGPPDMSKLKSVYFPYQPLFSCPILILILPLEYGCCTDVCYSRWLWPFLPSALQNPSLDRVALGNRRPQNFSISHLPAANSSTPIPRSLESSWSVSTALLYRRKHVLRWLQRFISTRGQRTSCGSGLD